MMLGVKTDSWTILNEAGAKAIGFDVFVNFDVKSENKITTAPVEKGNFVSYNKVISPLDLSLQVAKMGTPSELQSAVSDLLSFSASTQLVSLITPEQEYKNLNITKVAYRRSADEGVDVIYIDVGLSEVRQVSSEYTNVRVANKKSRGKQQTNSETSFLEGLFS